MARKLRVGFVGLGRVFDLDVRSVIAVSRAALAWLVRQGGSVIHTTSIAARNGGADGAVL